MAGMTPQEIEEFIKSEEKWNELYFIEKVWNEIHKNIKKKCTNCQEYPKCLKEGTTEEEACKSWFLSLRVFEGILEKYRQAIKEKQNKSTGDEQK